MLAGNVHWTTGKQASPDRRTTFRNLSLAKQQIYRRSTFVGRQWENERNICSEKAKTTSLPADAGRRRRRCRRFWENRGPSSVREAASIISITLEKQLAAASCGADRPRFCRGFLGSMNFNFPQKPRTSCGCLWLVRTFASETFAEGNKGTIATKKSSTSLKGTPFS